MVIEIRLTSDRTGNGLMVQLADEPASRHIPDVDRSSEVRKLWVPDGSQTYLSRDYDPCVNVPGQGPMSLLDAYYLFWKYNATGKEI